MKVVVIHAIYKPDCRGGAEVVVENIVRGLQARGDEVAVIALGRNEAAGLENFGGRASSSGKPEIVDGVKVYRVRSRNIFNFLDIIGRPLWQRLPWHVIDMFNFAQARQIREILLAEKPALILTHSLKGLGYQVPRMIKKFVREAGSGEAEERREARGNSGNIFLAAVAPAETALTRRHWLHTVHDMQLIHPSGLLGGGRTAGGVGASRRGNLAALRQTPHEPKENFVCRFLAVIYRAFCRWLFVSPPVVAFPSKHIKNIYEQYGFFPDSARVVIANPLYSKTELIKPELPNELAVATGITDQNRIESVPRRLNILFLGQIEEYKGVLVLIEAFKALKASLGVKADKTVLNIVGDGRALSEAKILAQKGFRQGNCETLNKPDKAAIKFWGRLSQSELNEKIWPQTDLLINPSQTPESFGMVVIEAYAHSVPVLVSDMGALPELVLEGETGWIVETAETATGAAVDFDTNQKAVKIWQQALADFLITSQEQGKMKIIKENCLRESKKYSAEKYLAAVMAGLKFF